MFKVSDQRKFQMSRFCVTTSETHIPKRTLFLSFQPELASISTGKAQFKTNHFSSHAKRNEKMNHV